MLILALDTTTDLCSVALLHDGALAERTVEAGQSHSRLLLPMIDALLAEAGVALQALDAIAFGAGPGSFTGVRIACGVAQGLALGIDRPLLPVESLAAVALAGGAPRVIACLDARMGEVYFAAYEFAAPRAAAVETGGVRACARPRTVIEPGVHRPQAVPRPAGGGWAGCGNGFAAHADALAQRLAPPAQAGGGAAGASLLARIDASVAPRAREVAWLGAAAFAAGEAIAPDLAAPRYVRNKVALDVGEQAALRAGDAAGPLQPRVAAAGR